MPVCSRDSLRCLHVSTVVALVVFLLGVSPVAYPAVNSPTITENPDLSERDRARLLEILPGELADSSSEPIIAACFSAARAGDDRALMALAAIDAGRDAVRAESRIVIEAVNEGATPRELAEIRAERATDERQRAMKRANARLMAGRSYCQGVFDSRRRGQ